MTRPRLIAAAGLLVALLVSPADAQVLCPDDSWVARGPCVLCPNGRYIEGGTQCELAPNGTFVPLGPRGEPPQMTPDGSYVQGGRPVTLCPDGSYVAGARCVPTPDGTFVGGGSAPAEGR